MISKREWIGTGIDKEYLPEFPILSELFVRPYNFIYDETLNPNGEEDVLQDPNEVWNFPNNLYRRGYPAPQNADIITVDRWELENNSIRFLEDFPQLNSRVYFEVATTSDEFGDTLRDATLEKMEAMLAQAEDYYDLCVLEYDKCVLQVGLAEDEVQKAKDEVALAKIEVQLCKDEVQKAKEYSWIAEAEALNSYSYSSQPYGEFVKHYISNGDGSFTITDTTDYSALHYSQTEKALVDLTDTPINYIGEAGKVLEVNDTEDGIVFKDRPLSAPVLAQVAKSFTVGEKYIIDLAETVVSPNVAITYETPDADLIDTTWNVALDGSNYDVEDFARDETITIVDTFGNISITKPSGNWASNDIGKVLRAGTGEAVMKDIFGGVEVLTAFDTTSYVSGDWTLTAIKFVAGGATIESNTLGLPGFDRPFTQATTDNTQAQTSLMLDDGNIMYFYQKSNNSGYFKIVNMFGTEITAETSIGQTAGTTGLSLNKLSDGNILFGYNGGYFQVRTQSGASVVGHTVIGGTSEYKIQVILGGFTVGYHSSGNPKNIRVNNDLSYSGEQYSVSTPTYCSRGTSMKMGNGNILWYYSTTTGLYIMITNILGATVLSETLLDTSDWALTLRMEEIGTDKIALFYGEENITNTHRCIIINEAGTVTTASFLIDTLVDLHRSGAATSKTNSGDVLYIYNDITTGYIKSATITDLGVITGPTNLTTNQNTIQPYVSKGEYNNDATVIALEETTPSSGFVLKKYDSFTDYVATNQNLLIKTNTAGSIDSTEWIDVNAMIPVETLNSQTIHYAVSIDDNITWYIGLVGSGFRAIVRDNNGVWEYNSNAIYSLETWNPVIGNTEFKALNTALDYPVNQMDGAQMLALGEDSFATGNIIDLVMNLRTTEPTQLPIADGVIIQYDGKLIYEGAVNGVDYKYAQIENDTKIRVEALKTNNLKIRIT